MSTSLYPKYRKRIDDAVDLLIKNQVTPWAFMNSGKPLRVRRFDQGEISYEGIGYEGSPAHVFWNGYIEPFIEDIVVREIDSASKEAKERNVDARLLLPEIKSLFQSGIRKIYGEMSIIDQRLRGKGFPDSVERRSINKEFENMMEFVETHIRVELEMWKPRSKLEIWYEQNKFLVWAIGVLVGLAGLYAKFK